MDLESKSILAQTLWDPPKPQGQRRPDMGINTLTWPFLIGVIDANRR
jgi:hypothetical protein